MKQIRWLPFVLGLLITVACSSSPPERETPLFSLLPSDSTGVSFVNEIVDRPGLNVLAYEYFYNGGGVAVGDVNGDGRPDLYFTANLKPNALYLNEGNFQFRDVTKQAGVQGRVGWTTGVTMADVNGDGHLDIYVCRSGRVSEERRRNELYINNGDGTFTEQATAYGVDSPAHSTQATFFDYDRDGDLDLYLLNHSTERYSRYHVYFIKQRRDPLAGDKLFRNDDGQFVDVSEEAGIIGHPLGFGLSATVSDINQDGWPDLYVANDYVEDDYLYINQGDGTFKETIRSWLDHTSYSSMGADIADYNNDGRPDIYTLDMLAEGYKRQKLLKGPEDYAFYEQMRSRGFHLQYMRNMLHLNNGNGTFSEIGQLAGVSTTDWSWAALFADFDLDGFKDLYVTNGYRRDYTNLDFLNSTLFPAVEKKPGNEQQRDSAAPSMYEMVQQMPSTPIANYAFRNAGDLTFQDRSRAWGLDQKGFSNGAAYADLDADGDLDLVVNNINREAFVYRNNARERTENNYLRVRLAGGRGNRFGIGATVTLTTPNGQTFYQEMVPARGFQSAVEPVLSFGLGTAEAVDLAVTWPDQTRQHLDDVTVNQTLTLQQSDARPTEPAPEPRLDRYFADESGQRGLSFTHRENAFVDFEHELLLPHMLSRLGPALACADVNGDGRDDVFVGGARGQRAALFLQQPDGSFEQRSVQVFSAHRGYEDVAALFVDVDDDTDQDLYVVSGGSAASQSIAYQDRVYLNDGSGGFTYGTNVLPTIESSGGTVAAHDYDGDGDQDLFVGGRVQPGRYPYPPRSYLLENTGDQFKDVTAEVAASLTKPGMITDALWHDLDDDGTAELVLAGEWMPIRVFRHTPEGTFREVSSTMGFDQTDGWWYRLAAADLDGDGDTDLIAGNRGLNAQMEASPAQPASIYAADFDQNGSVDPIMSYYMQGAERPAPWRDELLRQIPSFKEKFPTYASYAEATIDDVLAEKQRSEALHLSVRAFASSLFENQGDATFQRHDLPIEAQFSPTRGIVVRDVNNDNRPDVLLAGNDFTVRTQWGRADAGKGVVLINQGSLQFEALRARSSGFFAPADVRDLALVPADGPLIVVANNDATLSTFALRSSSQEVAAR